MLSHRTEFFSFLKLNNTPFYVCHPSVSTGGRFQELPWIPTSVAAQVLRPLPSPRVWDQQRRRVTVQLTAPPTHPHEHAGGSHSLAAVQDAAGSRELGLSEVMALFPSDVHPEVGLMSQTGGSACGSLRNCQAVFHRPPPGASPPLHTRFPLPRPRHAVLSPVCSSSLDPGSPCRSTASLPAVRTRTLHGREYHNSLAQPAADEIRVISSWGPSQCCREPPRKRIWVHSLVLVTQDYT